MMIFKALIVTSALGLASIAGDYGLKISDDKGNCHLKGLPSWPIHSTSEVAEDIKSYFLDGTFKIKMFQSYLKNGHVTYCGKYKAQIIHKAFIDVCTQGPQMNKAHLKSFLNILDREKFDVEIEGILAKKEISEKDALRLKTCLSK